MSIVILQDQLVHYEVLGRGRPLIFLHTWVGSWRYWIPAMQAASISFRTYALDLWGFGDTTKFDERYNLEGQVHLIDLFLQEMGIGKVALVGHGLGSVVALLFASQNKRMVDRVMLIGLPDGGRCDSGRKLNGRLKNAPVNELTEWLAGRTPEGEAARAEAPKADQQAIQTALESLELLDTAAITQNLDIPCLMVHGQNDPIFEGSIAPEMPAGLPEHVHQIVFEQSGHFPMLDEGSKFNRLVADFLSLTSGISPRQLQLKEEWKRRVR